MFGSGQRARENAALRSEVTLQGQTLAALGSASAVIRFTPEGTVVEVNENFLDIMGYRSATELIGRKHSLFCDPACIRSGGERDFWQSVCREDQARALVERVRADGRRIWLDARYQRVLDARGALGSILLCALDVTAWVEEQARHKAILTAMDRAMAVIEFSPEGVILEANANFLAATGYALEDIQGRQHAMFCLPEFADSPAYAMFWRDLRDGRIQAGRVQRLGRNRREVWLEATYNPVFDASGKVSSVVKFATDITREVALEARKTELAAQAHAISQQAQQESMEGAASVARGRSAVNGMAATIEVAAREVRELGEASGRIGSIVQTIREISSQTNLLALNASIEAARAGEQGRGFAVVADEVRKLSERTAGSTAEVAQVVTSIQTQARHAVDGIDAIVAQAHEGVRWIDQAGSAIAHMRSATESVLETVEALAQAS